MKYLRGYLFILTCLLSSVPGLSFAVKINKICHEKIELKSIRKGYTKTVFVQSFSGENNCFFISYNTYEKVKNIDVRIYDQKKERFVSQNYFWKDYNVPSDDFYSSTKVKEITFPVKTYFTVSYEIESDEIMLLHDFDFYTGAQVDTFYYNIYVPEDLNLKYLIRNRELLTYFRNDSLPDPSGGYSREFTCVLQKNSKYLENNSRIRIKSSRINLMITPLQFRNFEKTYFNDWFYSRITPTSNLNNDSKKIIDSITSGITSRENIAKALYDFVRDRIKYISIEVGYGGFIPGDVNEILLKRHGDCKDKSNLLCSALRYKGIPADLAVTASMTTNKNMDFPSISSGNHMIAAISISDSSVIFLDPTEEESAFGHTGPMTQGQSALIINSKGGEFITIPVLDPEKNLEEYKFELTQKKDSVCGLLSIELSGIPASMMLSYLKAFPPQQRESKLREYIKADFKNIQIRNVLFSQGIEQLEVKALISLEQNIFTNIGDKEYFSFNFLPVPIEIINEDPLPGDIVISHSVKVRTSVSLLLEKSKNAINSPSFSYSEDGFNFMMKSSCNGKLLQISYDFIYDDPIIEKSKNEQYHKFRNYVSKTFNNAMRLQ